MDIEIYFEDLDEFRIPESQVRDCILTIISEEGKEAGDITIILCSDEYLYQMNKQYLQHDYYTDIITFDYVEGDRISGDLFISMDRIEENANDRDIDKVDELLRIIVHGVLHLVGYKDKSAEDKKLMTNKEDYYLKYGK